MRSPERSRARRDEKHDGKTTLRELFAYARKVVYQLSDERQNIVTLESPHRDLDRDVVLQWGDRGVAHPTPTPPVKAVPLCRASGNPGPHCVRHGATATSLRACKLSRRPSRS